MPTKSKQRKNPFQEARRTNIELVKFWINAIPSDKLDIQALIKKVVLEMGCTIPKAREYVEIALGDPKIE